jgi:hypothetical protein
MWKFFVAFARYGAKQPFQRTLVRYFFVKKIYRDGYERNRKAVTILVSRRSQKNYLAEAPARYLLRSDKSLVTIQVASISVVAKIPLSSLTSRLYFAVGSNFHKGIESGIYPIMSNYSGSQSDWLAF